MGSKTVENLIIVILIVAILYMLFKNENIDLMKKYRNSINEITRDKMVKGVKFAEKNEEIILENVIPDNKSDSKSDSKSDKDSEDLLGHEWGTDYEQINEFVKEYKDYGRFAKGNEGIPKASEAEINSYRKSFFDFRNYVDQTSNGFDAVDNMNLEKIKEMNSSGMKVSDVYDKITANNYRESNIDVVGMQHNQKVDNIIKANEFSYDTDTVNNGAFFFDKVTGFDKQTCGHAI